MSKGKIQDPRIKIKPSEQLRNFIKGLHDYSELPENIAKIYNAYNASPKKATNIEYIPKEPISENERKILINISSSTTCYNLPEVTNIEEETEDVEETRVDTTTEAKSKTKLKKLKAEEKEKYKSNLHLELNDIKWLNDVLKRKRDKNESNIYLHELLEESKLILPENEIIPRNPELEARCQKLRREQEAREYENMTKNVDPSRKFTPEDTISFQMKAINKQLIAVLQFIFSVIAGFAFGFLGIELIIGNLDFGFRLLLGIMCALIIALAEIYFLAKKLNEYDEIPVQKPQRESTKVHQD